MNEMDNKRVPVRKGIEHGKLNKLAGKYINSVVSFAVASLAYSHLFPMSERNTEMAENPFTSLLTETECSASPALRRSTRARSLPYATTRNLHTMTGVLRTPVGASQSNDAASQQPDS